MTTNFGGYYEIKHELLLEYFWGIKEGSKNQACQESPHILAMNFVYKSVEYFYLVPL